MSDATRERVYLAVDILKPKHKAKLWLLLKEYMMKEEQNEDPFTSDKIVIHNKEVPESCESCSS